MPSIRTRRKNLKLSPFKEICMAQKGTTYTQAAVGRRKEAVARVYLAPGDGGMDINGRALEEYFHRKLYINEILRPFAVAKLEGRYHTHVRVQGGGTTGQAEAI